MKDANDEFVIIIKEKEEIFRKMIFSDPIVSSINIPISRDLLGRNLGGFSISSSIPLVPTPPGPEGRAILMVLT
jgi:hypothetical protein